MTQKFDPNLRAAMAEMREILVKRDIGAHILLASPTHTEFALFYEVPTWSVVTIHRDEHGTGLRVRAKKDNPDDQRNLASSIHMLMSFKDQLVNGFGAVSGLVDALRKHVAILHRNQVGEKPDSVP